MHDLTPTLALGGPAPRQATHGPLTLTETPDLALASLALRRGAAAPAPFGLTLPAPGRWAEAEGVAAFWAAPDQWMLAAPGRAETDFATELAGAVSGCSVTEQTDGWVVLDITAQEAAALERMLEKLVNIDLARFGPGSVLRTGLEHMSVFAIRRSAAQVTVMAMRSAAESLWHALDTAAARATA